MARKRKRPKSVRKLQAFQKEEPEELKNAPHSFVIHQGKVGKFVRQLIRDVRQVMEPYTASRVKVKKWNKLKDFTSISGLLNVSQILCFSKTDSFVNLRIVCNPRGPTLHFKVRQYTLGRDVKSASKKVTQSPKQFEHHPLLVMKNLGEKSMHIKLIATIFQNMFPTINVNNVKLKHIQRCLLLSYNPDTKLIEFRHYNISLVPVGLGKAVRKLIKGKKLPNLGKYQDISSYVEMGGNLSESEAEMDGPHNEVVLPQKMMGKGNTVSMKSAIRLTELGPRMTLELIKVEEGVCSGDVLYHSYKTLSTEELQAALKRKEDKQKLKEKRKKIQRDNVLRKAREKAQHKARSLEGIKKAQELKEESQKEAGVDDTGVPEAVDDDLDDDIKYYREEVQAEPEPELFSRKRKQTPNSGNATKKMKKDVEKMPPKAKFFRTKNVSKAEKFGNSKNIASKSKPKLKSSMKKGKLSSKKKMNFKPGSKRR